MSTGQISISRTASPTNVTVSSEHLLHQISDAELGQLGETHKGLAADICLTSVGGLIGALAPAFDAIRRFNTPATALSGVDLLTIVIAAICLVVAIITGCMWRAQVRRKGSLIDEIRSRPKIPLKQTG